jgi:small conductance mechanosensitive channel
MVGFYRSILRLGLLAAFLLAASAGAADTSPETPQPPDTAGDVRLPEGAASVEAEADPQLVRIEEIRAELAAQRREVLAMEADARQARGEDLVALRGKAIEMRFAAVGSLREMIEAVLALESRGGDVSLYRSELGELLPSLTVSIRSHFDVLQASLDRLKAERDEAGPGVQLAVEQDIQHQDVLIGRILAVGVDHVDTLDSFDLESDEARVWLRQQLAARARLKSAHMHLVSRLLADVEERGAATPDDAAILAEAMAAGVRLESNTEALSATVDLMERLEMDVAQYRQLLIQSTGEITVDVFDRSVASELLARWVASVSESIVDNGPGAVFKTLIFLLVLAAFWGISRFVRKVTERAVAAPHLRLSELVKRMIVSVASGTVVILGLLVAFSQLGFQVGPMLAGLGIAGFIVGFALQDTLGNFASGILILIYRPYDVGDLIECASGVFGRVSRMNLVSTTILTLDNQTRVVPNGKIWGDVITNVTAQKVRRVDLSFGISYQDGIPHAEQVLRSILEEHPKVLGDPEFVVKLHELGDSSVNFVVRPWVARDDYWDVYWDVTREVKLRFDREGISIPFPQRDVHLPTTADDAAAPAAPQSSPAFETSSTSAQDAPELDA